MKAFATILIAFLSLLLSPLAQSQTPLWTHQLGVVSRVSTSYQKTLLDSQGNLLLFGRGAEGAFVAKVDPTGALAWRTVLPRYVPAYSIYVDANGDVYVILAQGPYPLVSSLYHLRGTDGTVLWSIDLAAKYNLREPFVFGAGPDRILVIGSKEPQDVKALAFEYNKATGKQVANASYDILHIRDAAQLTPDSIVVQGSDGAFTRINASDLSIAWTSTVPLPDGYTYASGVGIATDGQGTLYSARQVQAPPNSAGAFARLDPETGETIWQTVIANNPPYYWDWTLDPNGNPVVWVASTVYKLSRSDGSNQWQTPIAGGILAGTTDASGNVYVAYRQSGVGVAKLDGSTGTPIYVGAPMSPDSGYPLNPAPGIVPDVRVLPSGLVAVVASIQSYVYTAAIWWFDAGSGVGLRYDPYIERAPVGITPVDPIAIGNDTVLAGCFNYGWAFERLDKGGKVLWSRQIQFPNKPFGRYDLSGVFLKSVAYAKDQGGEDSLYAAGYLGSDAVLLRLDATTGDTLWTWDVTRQFGLNYVHNVVTTRNGDAILFGSVSVGKSVWAMRIRSSDHKVLWWKNLPFVWQDQYYENYHVVARVPAGDVIVGTGYGYGLARLSSATGRIVWNRSDAYGLILFDSESNLYTFPNSTDLQLAKLDYATGTTLASHPLDMSDVASWLSMPVMLPNGQMGLLVVKADGTVWFKAFSLADATLQWEASIPALDGVSVYWPITIAASGGVVYLNVTTSDGQQLGWITIAVDPTTHSQAWASTSELGQQAALLPMRNGDVVAVGSVPRDGIQVVEAHRYAGG